MCQYSSSLIIGKRAMGKSYLVKDLLQYISTNNNNNIIVINPTEIVDKFYQKIKNIDDCLIYDELDENITELYINQQINNIEKKEENCDGIFIMDNCYSSRKQYSTSNLRNLLLNNKHLKTTIIQTVPTLFDFDLFILLSFDYIFIFREYVMSNIKKIYTSFFNLIDDDTNITCEEFINIVQNLDQYECIVIVIEKIKNNKIYWYKGNINYIKNIIKIQNQWRKILAQRIEQRLLIKREIEHLPNIGIKYFSAMKEFKSLSNMNL